MGVVTCTHHLPVDFTTIHNIFFFFLENDLAKLPRTPPPPHPLSLLNQPVTTSGRQPVSCPAGIHCCLSVKYLVYSLLKGLLCCLDGFGNTIGHVAAHRHWRVRKLIHSAILKQWITEKFSVLALWTQSVFLWLNSSLERGCGTEGGERGNISEEALK